MLLSMRHGFSKQRNVYVFLYVRVCQLMLFYDMLHYNFSILFSKGFITTVFIGLGIYYHHLHHIFFVLRQRRSIHYTNRYIYIEGKHVQQVQ